MPYVAKIKESLNERGMQAFDSIFAFQHLSLEDKNGFSENVYQRWNHFLPLLFGTSMKSFYVNMHRIDHVWRFTFHKIYQNPLTQKAIEWLPQKIEIIQYRFDINWNIYCEYVLCIVHKRNAINLFVSL